MTLTEQTRTVSMNPKDRKFADRLTQETAPAHQVAISHAADLVEFGRYKLMLFLIVAFTVSLTSVLLDGWLDWTVRIAVVIAALVLLGRRGKQIEDAHDRRRDAYLYPVVYPYRRPKGRRAASTGSTELAA